MATGITAEEYFDGPVYALIIGINYVYPDDQKDNRFQTLKFAGKDAEDFRDHLVDKGVNPDCIIDLIDNNATCAEIKIGLKRLVSFERQYASNSSKKPLIIIFFSGHGEQDAGQLHFIPYDAKLNAVKETALSKDDFESYLEKLATDKLVVFLDACHSGGATGDGKKGGESKFNPSILGEGKGRYVFASCSEDESSYEGERNGIFTEELLRLLNGEGIEEEEINTNNLFLALTKRVEQSAWALKKQPQHPTKKSISEQKPIILGVNFKKKQQRKKVEFLQEVSEELKKMPDDLSPILIERLEDYVNDTGDGAFRDLYVLFDSYFIQQGNFPVQQVCKDLIKRFDKILNPVQRPKNSSLNPVPQSLVPDREAGSSNAPRDRNSDPEISLPTKEVETAPDNKIERSLDNKFVPPETKVAGPEDKFEIRNLTDKRDEILDKINADLDFLKEAKKLRNLLNQPVSKEVFTQELKKMIDNTDDDSAEKIFADIGKRFNEFWKDAPIAEKLTGANFRYKSKDI
jgi:Caspase domain